MNEKSGPRPAATGVALKTQGVLGFHDSTNGRPGEQAADGERRKLAAHKVLRVRHPGRIRAAQVAFLKILLQRGAVTVDDVRAALELGDGERALWLGAAVGELRRAGIIARRGFVESRRAVAHARPISVWQLGDADAARRWLRANAERPDRLGR